MLRLIFFLVIVFVLLYVLLLVIRFIRAVLDTPEKKEERERRRKEEEKRRKEEEKRRKEEEARRKLEAARRRLVELGERASSERGSATARWLDERFLRVSQMDGEEFESFCRDLFTALGFLALRLGGPGDQGADLLLRGGPQEVAVQCKNHAKPVGNRAVQEVFAGAKYHGASEAWVVAPNGYTAGAREAAERLDVILLDGAGIKRLIEQVRSAAPPKSGQGIPNGVLYELLLGEYRDYVELAGQAAEERAQGAGDPEVETQFAKTEEAIFTSMREALAKLDALERRDPKRPKVDSAERQAWQARIEKAARRKPRRLRQFDDK